MRKLKKSRLFTLENMNKEDRKFAKMKENEEKNAHNFYFSNTPENGTK